VDRAVDAGAREQRQPAGVIDVRMRQDDGGELVAVERDRRVLLARFSAATLKGAEVQCDGRSADAQQVARARYLARRPEKRDVHGRETYRDLPPEGPLLALAVACHHNALRLSNRRPPVVPLPPTERWLAAYPRGLRRTGE